MRCTVSTGSAFAFKVECRAYPVAVTRCFRHIIRRRGARQGCCGNVNRGWRDGYRLGFHLWCFYVSGFTNGLCFNLNVLNHFFSDGFDNHVCSFFNSSCWFNFFRNLFSDHGVFFSDKVRCGINWRGNHFRMRGFNVNGVRRFSFNSLRFNHLRLHCNGCFCHRFFNGDNRGNHLFGDRLLFNNLLRTGNRIADPDLPGCHFR